MSEAIPTSVRVEGDTGVRAHSLITGVRLALAANTTLQLTILFAYLYLRANNFGGMWHPDGVSVPSIGTALAALVVPLVGVLLLWAALKAAERGTARTAMAGLLGLALVVGLITVGLRVYMQYHLGWSFDQGTYVAAATLWYAVILAEFVIGVLWLASLYAGHVRNTVTVTRSQLRTVFEFWTYVFAIAVAVFALVQFVT